MIKIGPHSLDSPLVLAPMAGVTDQPFRKLCRHYGAAITPSEMVTSNIRLWGRDKCRLRRCFDGEASPRVVQIAGADPAMMAQAARLNVDQGAEIIDINMGCPAKKVLKRSAGSALLRYPSLVKDILDAVIAAVDVPVTLKIRTGWAPEHRNGVDIARLAEDCGISSLAVHGRTRACAFRGEVEYDTIAAIKAAVSMPVFANGDINTPQQAARVLAHTGADGLMIGRGAQGRPWIFSEINHFLVTGNTAPAPDPAEIGRIMTGHVRSVHAFYGDDKGLLFARKHVAWYLETLRKSRLADAAARDLRRRFNGLQDCRAQLEFLETFSEQLAVQTKQKPTTEGMAA